MKNILWIILGLSGAAASLPARAAESTATQSVLNLAHANGYRPTMRVVRAIVSASKAYHVSAQELTAIAILETGLGRFERVRHNANGTVDLGLFQINTINRPKCVEYDLTKPEGSALCAAKLLSGIRRTRPDYLGVYHSKTPSKKKAYEKRINQVMWTAGQTENGVYVSVKGF